MLNITYQESYVEEHVVYIYLKLQEIHSWTH